MARRQCALPLGVHIEILICHALRVQRCAECQRIVHHGAFAALLCLIDHVLKHIRREGARSGIHRAQLVDVFLHHDRL